MPVTQRVVAFCLMFIPLVPAMADLTEATDVGFFSVKARMVQVSCAVQLPLMKAETLTLTGCPAVPLHITVKGRAGELPATATLAGSPLNENDWRLYLPSLSADRESQSPLTLQVDYY